MAFSRLRQILLEAGTLSFEGGNMSGQKMVHPLLRAFFSGLPLDRLEIVERNFPFRCRIDVLQAVQEHLSGMTVHHFGAVQRHFQGEGLSFSDLLTADANMPVLSVPLQYEEIDTGETEPIRCLKTGFWLVQKDDVRFAVLATPKNLGYSSVVKVEVAALIRDSMPAISQGVFKQVERAVAEAKSYRGKILSLEQEANYSGAAIGIKVHRLRRVPREEVILPAQTLDLLDRNVVQFVRQRSRLAALGLATKKGLLFYGVPGTGKTHTIHYLTAVLPGVTTLLITAEQVGLLGEYMSLARLLQPSMVIIEDADLIGRERVSIGVQQEVLLNKLLNEMDGLKEDGEIMFILTTNRPEALEQALSGRPGRIDQAIEFPLPDEQGRRRLMRLYAGAIEMSAEVLDAAAKRTRNVSAAFIKELMRRAAQFHLERNNSAAVTEEDLQLALDELLFKGGVLNQKLLGAYIDQES